MLLELALLGAFSALWILVLLTNLGFLALAGTLDLGLYQLYSLTAALGWVAGNIYVLRRPRHPQRYRKRLLLSYLLAPPSIIFLLRLLASRSVQAAAPLVPLFALLMYALFFLVPWSLRASRKPRRKPFQDR